MYTMYVTNRKKMKTSQESRDDDIPDHLRYIVNNLVLSYVIYRCGTYLWPILSPLTNLSIVP